MLEVPVVMEIPERTSQLLEQKLPHHAEKFTDDSDSYILDLSTVYYFKGLIKKYQKQIGDLGATRVCSGGLQQYLNKESEKMEKLQKENHIRDESNFERLPVNVKLHIFSYLSATDLCRLSVVSRSWNEITGDNILWQGILERDIFRWSTIGHNTNPDIYKEVESDWTNKQIYLRCTPEIQRMEKSHNYIDMLANISEFIRNLMPKTPLFAMFGPGLETDTSALVRNLMNSDKMQRIGMFPGHFGAGVGGGFTYKYQSTKFSLSVLYSAPKSERENSQRDRAQQHKLLVENSQAEGSEKYDLVPAVQDFCRTAVNGFVYVCDATASVPSIESGLSELQAMVSERWSATHIPVLVLSMVKNPEDCRVPCIQVVRRLQLSNLNRPWQVRNCVASNLDGVLEGFTWLAEQANKR